MSAEDSRARRTGPFVQTVASATWLPAIEGLRSSFPSLSSAYVRICWLISTFRPFTWRRIWHGNLADGPREGDDLDPARPGFPECRRGCRDRGAGGVHVVDEHKRSRRGLGRLEDVADVSAPLGQWKPALGPDTRRAPQKRDDR